MTLEQVRKDIADGLTTQIWFSTGTRWWTHIKTDIDEAIKLGELQRDQDISDMLLDPNVTLEKKAELSRKAKLLKEQVVKTPIDPMGAPLLVAPAEEWLKWVLEDLSVIIGHEKILMKSHHQNCGGKCSADWNFYLRLVENETITN